MSAPLRCDPDGLEHLCVFAGRMRGRCSGRAARKVLNAPGGSMQLYLEFGGGLGDIFYQMFHDGGYGALQTLTSKDRALIVLITHNPHARELFDHHPRAS